MRKLFNVFIILFLLIANNGFAQNGELKNINLSVGLFQDIPLPEAPSSIEPAGTYKSCASVSYNDAKKILRIDPKKEGYCTLVIKNPITQQSIYNFTLDVKKTDINKVASEVRSLLGEIDGIQIKVMNNKVLVDGEVILPADIARIHSVVKQYEPMAATFVRLSPGAQNKIAQFIERAIGNPEVHVRAVNGKFILEGFVDSEDDKKKAQIIAETYAPDIVTEEAYADRKIAAQVTPAVVNLLSIRAPATPDKKMVQIVVHYVELQKDYNKGFRFQWTPDVGDGTNVTFASGGRQPGGVTSTITGTISNLLPKLNWAKQHGHARVLQSSSILVEDRKAGLINSIQQVPYQTLAQNGMPVVSFQDVGLKTSVTPSITGQRSESIDLKLEFSISSLIGSSATGPLTSRRDIRTELTVRSGQSAAIGGLISSDTDTSYNKLPPSASANPIVSLYASKTFRKNQSQFVVFVTPIIKASASSGTDEVKRKFKLRD
jgi:pilus assembly protein CpaC